MPSITRSVNIRALPDIVWTVLVQHLEHPEHPIPFDGKPPRIEPAGGSPLSIERQGVGTRTRWRYRFRGREHVWDDIVTEWVEKRKIAWKATSGMKLEDYFELMPDGTTTNLRYCMSYEAPYWPLGAISEYLFYRSPIIENIEWTLKILKHNAERIASLRRVSSLNQN